MDCWDMILYHTGDTRYMIIQIQKLILILAPQGIFLLFLINTHSNSGILSAPVQAALFMGKPFLKLQTDGIVLKITILLNCADRWGWVCGSSCQCLAS